MKDEDIKNLIGWLQAIHKEAQAARSAAAESRDKTVELDEIRDVVSREGNNNAEIDHKIDEVKRHLESKIDKLDHQINDLKNLLNDIRGKVEKLQ